MPRLAPARALALTALAACGLAACGLAVSGSLAEETPPSRDASVDEARPPAADSDVDADGDGDGQADAADGGDAADAIVDAPPDVVVTPAVGATTRSALSLTLDYAKPGDGTIMTDGVNDGIFDVTVTGPALALALIRTDATGRPTNNQQWDTWVGADVIPSGVDAGFSAGSSTYQLAVREGGNLVNDGAGRVTLAAGDHALRIAGSNVGSFVAGNYFRVVAQLPDAGIIKGPVVAY